VPAFLVLEQNKPALICDGGIAVKAQFLSCAGVTATFATPLENRYKDPRYRASL